MTEEELQEEQRRDFEARRDLAFKQLVCALNEGDAEKFERSFEAWRKKRNTAIKEVLNVLVDSDLTYEEAVNVLDGCRTYLRHNLKIENIDLNVEEREPF